MSLKELDFESCRLATTTLALVRRSRLRVLHFGFSAKVAVARSSLWLRKDTGILVAKGQEVHEGLCKHLSSLFKN